MWMLPLYLHVNKESDEDECTAHTKETSLKILANLVVESRVVTFQFSIKEEKYLNLNKYFAGHLVIWVTGRDLGRIISPNERSVFAKSFQQMQDSCRTD